MKIFIEKYDEIHASILRFLMWWWNPQQILFSLLNYTTFIKHVLRTEKIIRRRWQSKFFVQYVFTIDFGSFTWPLLLSIYFKLHDLGNNWRGKAIMYPMKSVWIIHKYGRDINDDDVSNQTKELEDDLPFTCSISKEHHRN